MAFLEIVTRTYKRPALLRHNRASVERLTRDDWRQVFLVDDVGRGIGWAYDQLAQHTPVGEYVWILDDDDLCIYPQLVEALDIIDREHFPDVVMLKMDHGGHVLPDKFTWQKPPQLGHIGVSAFVVSRAIWLAHRHAFTPGHYASDFSFISSVFAANPVVYWHDVVASQVQRVSKGNPE